MQIGTFGNIVFEVSSDKILTFNGFQRTAKARFSEHKIIGEKPVLEATGLELDSVGFSISLNRAVGINPTEQISVLREMLLAQESHALIIGGKKIGSFVLTDLSDAWPKVTHKGQIAVAEIELKLLEYANE